MRDEQSRAVPARATAGPFSRGSRGIHEPHPPRQARAAPARADTETRAIRAVFGPHADRLMVSSVKGQAGHLLGAAGALSTAVAALSIDRGLVPATVNLETPGEGCDLDYVPDKPRERRVSVVLSNSFGFGGHNTSLVLRRVS